jgi:hypothetical protein
MKNIFYLLLFISTFPTKAQNKFEIILPIDSNTNRITYDTIINSRNIGKDTIFTKLEEWISLNYKSTNDVVQLKDKSAGIIIIKGIFPDIQFPGLASGRDVRHTAIFRVKDSKVRLTITNFQNVFPTIDKSVEIEITDKWQSTMYPNQRLPFQVNLNKRIMKYIQEVNTMLNNREKDW